MRLNINEFKKTIEYKNRNDETFLFFYHYNYIMFFCLDSDLKKFKKYDNVVFFKSKDSDFKDMSLVFIYEAIESRKK